VPACLAPKAPQDLVRSVNTGFSVVIGKRPLHVALGAGHRNASGGNPEEQELNGRICHAVLALARRSQGFAVRCYTPDDGLGMHPGEIDAGPLEVATLWDPVWPVDIFHELHTNAAAGNAQARGVFVVYPDFAEAEAGPPIAGDSDVDVDVRELGKAMSECIARATGLPLGGPKANGVLSEGETYVGKQGRRLRVFAATATPAMRAHSCRFITEIGCRTTPEDAAILAAPDFPRRAALGTLRAYAILARSRMGWTYPHSIAVARVPTGSAPADRARRAARLRAG
jgi:hypothetical protein